MENTVSPYKVERMKNPPVLSKPLHIIGPDGQRAHPDIFVYEEIAQQRADALNAAYAAGLSQQKGEGEVKVKCPGYMPDYQAMGDCANCGHIEEDHRRPPLPQGELTDEEIERIGRLRIDFPDWERAEIHGLEDVLVRHAMNCLRYARNNGYLSPQCRLSRDYNALYWHLLSGGDALGYVWPAGKDQFRAPIEAWAHASLIHVCYYAEDEQVTVRIEKTGSFTDGRPVGVDGLVAECQRLNLEWISPAKEG